VLNSFVVEEQSSGALDTIQQQAGLRGASKVTRE
jgi:polar amino acid transport system substrate-binding protein